MSSYSLINWDSFSVQLNDYAYCISVSMPINLTVLTGFVRIKNFCPGCHNKLQGFPDVVIMKPVQAVVLGLLPIPQSWGL